MDVWQLLLYGLASFLALRSLVSLMAHHKRQYQQELLAREAAERKAKKTPRPEPSEGEKVGETAA